LEVDNSQLNTKFRKQSQQKEKLFILNEKLSNGLKAANSKIIAVKEKYKSKMARKECKYCNNPLDLTVDATMSYDQINVS
jgi:hypothetical protein